MYFIRVIFVAILALMLVESSLAGSGRPCGGPVKTSCRGDENAYPSDCSNQCSKNCAEQFCTLDCVKGCSCKNNYLYDNKAKKCVLPQNCTSCRGDVNAFPSDCSNQCLKNCDKRVCTMDCRKGCSCKADYVYDNAVKRCVLPRNCSNRRGYY